MMKDTKTEKDKLHRYLDDLYTREEASQLLQSIKEAENQDLLDELAAEVWEESGNLQPATDLEREKFRYLQPYRSGGQAGRICTSFAPFL